MLAQDKNFSVLIVDDRAENIQLAAQVIKQAGYRVAYASSGKAALSTVKNFPFDLILLDIMMPEMDGFEVCKELKNNSQTKDIPVIVRIR